MPRLWTRLSGWWISIAMPPPFRDASPDVALRARLVVLTSGLFQLAALALLGVHIALGSRETIVLAVVLNAVCLVGILLLRATASLRLVGHYCGFLWIGLTIVALLYRGGLRGPIALVIAGAPVAVVFIAGRKAGALWAVVAIAAVVGFFGFEQAGFELVDRLPGYARGAVSAIVASTLTLIMLTVVVGLDRVNKAATESRDETTAKLHAAELERVRAEAATKVAHADRMASLGQLAAGVAHEVNNPLAYILANAHYVKGQLDGAVDDEVIEALSDLEQGATHLRRIVRSLSAFARHDADVDLGPVDLAEVAESAISLASPHTDHCASIERRFEADVPAVQGDAQQLTQVVLNLLINAAQSLPEHREQPRINVVVRRGDDDSVVLEVADNGAGIKPEQLDRVVEPFFTTKQVGVGTGLGLSVCKGIVERHRGTLTISSEQARGTTVTVVLPSCAAEQDEDESVAAEEIALEPLRILVVDDDPLVARGLVRMLSEHRVEVLSEGRAALERLRGDKSYDVVLCDVMMPDVSGVDLYERLGVSDTPALSRLVFITGGACTERTQRFLDTVDSPVLYKPLERDALLRAMQSIVR